MDKFRLSEELAAIGREERDRSRDRQSKAGVVPVKLNFAASLQEELAQAVSRLWLVGSSASTGTGRVDPVLRQPWSMVNKGTSCLSESDLIEFSKLPPGEMRAIGRWLIEGQTLEQAGWLARNSQKQKDPDE